MSKRDTRARDKCRSLKRKTNIRSIRQRFLIVCGGEKTEPNYFRAFQTPTIVLTIVPDSKDPAELVQSTWKRYLQELREGEQFDQVWCVFDCDEFPEYNINAALVLASKHHIRIAYSNECFELWYLLHYHYQDTAMCRRTIIARLEELLRHPYKKNTSSMYSKLESRVIDAIGHAKRLLSEYDPPDPARNNPSTTVHLLVEQLLFHSRYPPK